jgi:hypothetical protein
MLPVKLFKRDFGGMASVMGAVLLILAAPLASLREGVGPTVMAVGLLSAAAALLGILTAIENVMDDREGWIAPLIVGLGRGRYAALRAAVSTAVAVAAVAPALALYSLLIPASYLPVSAASILSAAVGAALGLLIGLSAPTRGHAYAWGVSLWTALALIYELALTFASIYFAVSEPLFAAALLANPLTAARLVGIALADPSLLTLGPAGTYLYKSLGAYALLLFPATAAVWYLALAAASIIAAHRRDL